MTAIQIAARTRRNDVSDALAEYDQTARWRWFKRGRLLFRAEVMAQSYACLITRVWQEADYGPPEAADESASRLANGTSSSRRSSRPDVSCAGTPPRRRRA